MMPVRKDRLSVSVICHFVRSLSVGFADAKRLLTSVVADIMVKGVFVLLLTVIVFLSWSLPGMSVKMRFLG